MAEEQAQGPDHRKWSPFRAVTNCTTLSPAVHDLFVACTEGSGVITLKDCICILTQIILVETGFLPVHDTCCLPILNDLMYEPLEGSINRCIDILKTIWEEKKTLAEVAYKYVIIKEDCTGVQQFDFANDVVQVKICMNNAIIIMASGKGFNKTVVVTKNDVSLFNFNHTINVDDFLRKPECQHICQLINNNFVAPISDNVGAVYISKTTFDDLEFKSLLSIVKKLDIRSINRLKSATPYLSVALENELVYESMFQNILRDLKAYDLPVPTADDLRNVAALEITWKEKCKIIFRDAQQELNELVNRSNTAFEFPNFLDMDD